MNIFKEAIKNLQRKIRQNNQTNLSSLSDPMTKIQQRVVHPEWGENAPVPNDSLPINPMPGTEVLITQDVKNVLDAMSDVTQEKTEEMTFLLFGRVEGQRVILDRCVAQRSADKSTSSSTNASDYTNQELNNFLNDNEKDGSSIVAWGHTHPRIGSWYTNFSLGDIKGLTDFRNGVDVFRTEQVNLCAVLLAGGNYNFLFFDGNDYYRFNKVFVVDESYRKIEQLPCYGPDVNLLQHGNRRDR